VFLIRKPSREEGQDEVRNKNINGLMLILAFLGIGLSCFLVGGIGGFFIGRNSISEAPPKQGSVPQSVVSPTPIVQVAEKPAVIEKNEEKPNPAPVPQQVDWIDIGQPCKSGAIEFKISKVEINRVMVCTINVDYIGIPSREKLVVFVIKMTNHGKEPINYKHPGDDYCKLTDDKQSKYLTVRYEMPDFIKDQISSAKIDPGKSINDLLVFSSANIDKAKDLFLEIHPFGAKVRYRIPVNSIAR
jgi:hypothetical protein